MRQTRINFGTDLKNVDWKLISRIQDKRIKASSEAEIIRLKQRAGAYHSLYIQAKKKIYQLKNKIQ